MNSASPDSMGPVASAWIDFAGHLHPVVLHFPVALLLVGAVAVVWNWLRGEEGVGEFAFHCLWIGAAMAVVAATTGWLFAEHESDEDGLELHRWFAVGATVAAIAVATLATLARTDERPGLVAVTRLAAMVTAVAMAFTGHLGGAMVWGEAAVTRPLWKAVEATWKSASGPAKQTSTGGSPPTAPAAPDREKESSPEPAKPAAAKPEPSIPAEESLDQAEPLQPTAIVSPGAVADDVPKPVPPKEPVSFRKHLLPMLKDRCFECHSGERPKDGVGFDHMDELVKTEGKKAVVFKGDPTRSTMFTTVMRADSHKKRMPPPKSGKRLTPEQAGLIEAWIKEGAKLDG